MAFTGLIRLPRLSVRFPTSGTTTSPLFAITANMRPVCVAVQQKPCTSWTTASPCTTLKSALAASIVNLTVHTGLFTSTGKNRTSFGRAIKRCLKAVPLHPEKRLRRLAPKKHPISTRKGVQPCLPTGQRVSWKNVPSVITGCTRVCYPAAWKRVRPMHGFLGTSSPLTATWPNCSVSSDRSDYGSNSEQIPMYFTSGISTRPSTGRLKEVFK